jgi:hypothetical protein
MGKGVESVEIGQQRVGTMSLQDLEHFPIDIYGPNETARLPYFEIAMIGRVRRTN